MIIREAKFLVSSSNVNQCPDSDIPEYAFIGRSNVGKSSLINMLTNNKKLAMTSSKPGKTRLINHFHINQEWHLVDLPGYGYTRTGKSSREQFSKLISDYVLKRLQLTSMFVLIDSRLTPQKIDIDFINWIGENGIPFSIVFTKADKISGSKVNTNIEAFNAELLKSWEETPPYFISSSVEGTGRKEILNYIDHINSELKKQTI
ncbi:ribosome biogenesis GTP-binding protein YihA/YsxC [Saccharicrinis sp. FJH54]|uniref:ribosome biogenesis GTP-binding protein YihA/YsxC n=1 Tax=Saccharicrinis sp. FJH54 TaxID=3344665 RepID=UPI0035D500ED